MIYYAILEDYLVYSIHLFLGGIRSMNRNYDGVPLLVRAIVYRRAGGICEGPAVRDPQGRGEYKAKFTGVCRKPGNDLCHITPKRMGGSLLLDTPENLLYLCREHHRQMDLSGGEQDGNVSHVQVVGSSPRA